MQTTRQSSVLLILAGVCWGLPSAPHHPPHHHNKFPSLNCTVEEVEEIAEVCTPSFTTVCEPISVPVKNIVDKEQCYSVTKTVCSASTEVIANEVCVFKYSQKEEVAEAVGAAVEYSPPCSKQMVTVCSPGYDYGVNCKEVEQETCYNQPEVVPAPEDRTVAYPEPADVCVDRDIQLPRISCEDIVSEVCITVPEVEEATAELEVCRTELGAPDCQEVGLSLPKEQCIEIVYGYTHGYDHGAPHH